jgi:hypothetical protein
MVIFATLVAAIYIWKFANISILSGIWAKYYPFLAMMLMIICLFLGNNITAKKIKTLRNEDLTKKLTEYKTIYSKRLKFFSAISLIAVVSMIMFASMYYIIFSILSLLLIIFSRVMSVKVKYELNLTEEEIKKVDKLKIK